MLIFLKVAWAGLIPIAIFFIALDLRTKFDRSFRYFGIAQLLLCAMTGIDIWILPGMHQPLGELFWTRAMFIVGCQFALFYFWYMSELSEWVNMAFIRVLSAYALLLSLLFLTDAMLRYGDGGVVRGLGFDFLFQPFMALCLFGALALISRKFRRAAAPERRVLLFHLAGFLMLFVFGCLDVTFTYYIPKPYFVSFNTFGSLSFGFWMSFIFLERLLLLLKEKEAMHGQIRSALQEVADSRAMKMVGESAAMLNHEIKNYVSIMKGNLLLIDPAGMPPETKGELDRIKRAATGLENISRGVLDMPNIFSLECREILLPALIEDILKRNFAPERERFSLGWVAPGARIAGDAVKLEQVFLNLLKNACEAGARSIRVGCVQTQWSYVISIEDDGKGCEPKHLDEMGKAFFTTKRRTGGTGLGICVSRAIIENHGGSLSFYSKNGLGQGRTGLIANAVFPRPAPSLPPPSPNGRRIAVFSRVPEVRARLSSTVRNLFLVPEELPELGAPAENRPADSIVVVAEEDTLAERTDVLRAGFSRTIRVRPNGFARCLGASGESIDEGIFSEEFLAICFPWPVGTR